MDRKSVINTDWLPCNKKPSSTGELMVVHRQQPVMQCQNVEFLFNQQWRIANEHEEPTLMDCAVATCPSCGNATNLAEEVAQLKAQMRAMLQLFLETRESRFVGHLAKMMALEHLCEHQGKTNALLAEKIRKNQRNINGMQLSMGIQQENQKLSIDTLGLLEERIALLEKQGCTHQREIVTVQQTEGKEPYSQKLGKMTTAQSAEIQACEQQINTISRFLLAQRSTIAGLSEQMTARQQEIAAIQQTVCALQQHAEAAANLPNLEASVAALSEQMRTRQQEIAAVQQTVSTLQQSTATTAGLNVLAETVGKIATQMHSHQNEIDGRISPMSRLVRDGYL